MNKTFFSSASFFLLAILASGQVLARDIQAVFEQLKDSGENYEPDGTVFEYISMGIRASR